MKIKIKIKNSCRGNRGCSVERLTLPYGIKFIPIHKKMYGRRNDIPKILSISYLPLDQVA